MRVLPTTLRAGATHPYQIGPFYIMCAPQSAFSLFCQCCVRLLTPSELGGRSTLLPNS